MNEIIINSVSKDIRKNRILHNINLELKGGAIYGLYGANGSGKTMLIRAIAGLMKPSKGTIAVIASHDKNVINSLCDIVFYISSGEIIKRVENK